MWCVGQNNILRSTVGLSWHYNFSVSLTMQNVRKPMMNSKAPEFNLDLPFRISVTIDISRVQPVTMMVTTTTMMVTMTTTMTMAMILYQMSSPAPTDDPMSSSLESAKPQVTDLATLRSIWKSVALNEFVSDNLHVSVSVCECIWVLVIRVHTWYSSILVHHHITPLVKKYTKKCVNLR